MDRSAQPKVRRPNRERPESRLTRTLVIALLLISAALVTLVSAAGWNTLQGAQVIQVFYVAAYIGFAVLVGRWNRGALSMAAALAIVLAIVASLAAPGWFGRDKPGFLQPAMPEDLLGLLTLLIVPLQILLVVFALRGFNQQWHVEEGPGADPTRLAR